MQGDSYGIPTKATPAKSLPLEIVKEYVNDFVEFTKLHGFNDAFSPNENPLIFKVTRVGCGLAGFTDEQIAPLFKGVFSNVHLPVEWKFILGEGLYNYWP
jgi:hypothetical protein